MNPDIQLRDIHLPEPVSWWPLAPGWWILIGLLILFILSLFLFFKYQKPERKPSDTKQLNSVLNEIKVLQKNFKNDHIAIAKELSVLLRKFSIYLYGKDKVSGLSGQNWLAFLDSKWSKKEFTQGVGQQLISMPYQSHTDVDSSALVQCVQAWIKVQLKQRKKDHV